MWWLYLIYGLTTGVLVVVLIIVIVKHNKLKKRAKEVLKGSKCPYEVDANGD